MRVDTFRSALEQAEQQFRAAASVDYDSRALNLYYGVSQAGRAVAAGLGQDESTLQAPLLVGE
ncbi:MAG: YaaC family protein [Pseudonocardiaceae bacterium]